MFRNDNLKRERLKKGWRQEDLANKLKTSRQLISDWEKGKKTPNGTSITKLMKVLNIDGNVLFEKV